MSDETTGKGKGGKGKGGGRGPRSTTPPPRSKARAKGDRLRRPTAPITMPPVIFAPPAPAAPPVPPAEKKDPRPRRPTTPGRAKARLARPTAPEKPIVVTPTVPLETTPPPVSDADLLDADDAYGDASYGAEAAPSPGNYAPEQDRRTELPYSRRSVTQEVLELERRIRARLTPAFPIFHRRHLPLEFLARRARDFAMRNRSDTVDDFGRDPMALARLRPVLDFLYDRYFRVEVEGAEHLPASGPAILVANHGGVLPYDVVLLAQAVRRSTAGRELRPLIEDALFHTPYLGPLLTRLGAVRACPENAARLLGGEQLVAVFPEGNKGLAKPLGERYRLRRFGRGGFVKLALASGAPIVPVTIVGSEETNPTLAKLPPLLRALGLPTMPLTATFPWLGPLGLMPLPVRWHIRIGAPIDLAGPYGTDAADDPVLVARLAENVRGTIQSQLDVATATRKSLFF